MSIIVDPSYTWTDASNNKWPICNAKFVYGCFNSTSFTGTDWKVLTINSSFTGNKTLLTLNNDNGLNVSVNGIYRLRVVLTFSGSPDTPAEYIIFSISNASINATVLNSTNSSYYYYTTDLTSNGSISTSTNSKIISFGDLYTLNTHGIIINPSYGVSFLIYATVISANTYENMGYSFIENILFLRNDTSLYFNVSGESPTPTTSVATGNFTLELLSAVT